MLFVVSGRMFCLVRYLFFISTGAFNFLGKFVSEMTCDEGHAELS